MPCTSSLKTPAHPNGPDGRISLLLPAYFHAPLGAAQIVYLKIRISKLSGRGKGRSGRRPIPAEARGRGAAGREQKSAKIHIFQSDSDSNPTCATDMLEILASVSPSIQGSLDPQRAGESAALPPLGRKGKGKERSDPLSQHWHLTVTGRVPAPRRLSSQSSGPFSARMKRWRVSLRLLLCVSPAQEGEGLTGEQTAGGSPLSLQSFPGHSVEVTGKSTIQVQPSGARQGPLHLTGGRKRKGQKCRADGEAGGSPRRSRGGEAGLPVPSGLAAWGLSACPRAVSRGKKAALETLGPTRGRKRVGKRWRNSGSPRRLFGLGAQGPRGKQKSPEQLLRNEIRRRAPSLPLAPGPTAWRSFRERMGCGVGGIRSPVQAGVEVREDGGPERIGGSTTPCTSTGPARKGPRMV